MAIPNRIKNKPEAATIAADDWAVLDGGVNGVRKFDPRKWVLLPTGGLAGQILGLDAGLEVVWLFAQSLPPGGLPGQVLAISSLGNVVWANPPSSATGIIISTATDYTGGGATRLDGEATVDVSVPTIYKFKHFALGWKEYLLRAGTDLESSPDIIRPDDYATTTNEKVFELVS